MVILFDQFNLPEDIFKIVFATEHQETVAKLLIKYIKENGGEIGKTEMSIFATLLHEGRLESTISEKLTGVELLSCRVALIGLFNRLITVTFIVTLSLPEGVLEPT